MPVRGNTDHLYLGRGVDHPGVDLRATLRQAVRDHFDFVSIPLAARGGQGRGVNFCPSVESDLALDAAQWHGAVVGSVSEALDPDGGADPAESDARCGALDTEIRWAIHLGLHGVLLPPPVGAGSGLATGGCGYARALSELLLSGAFVNDLDEDGGMPLAVRVPTNTSGWLAWNRLRTLCDHHPRLWVALEFTAEQPGSDRELQRWLGEPVKFVILPATAFVPNRQGYPVLLKRHKALLHGLFRHRVKVILMAPEGVVGEETASPVGAVEVAAPHSDLQPRINYVARLFQDRPTPTVAERFALSHLDYLQAPLQPLHDNLTSETYELFETDPVKYARYQEAVAKFLQDRVAGGGVPPFTIMVLGAGRGPLVNAALEAARRLEVAVAVWAVEKNPNAVHTLRHKKRTKEGWGCVEVIAEDMRAWKAPHKADAIISELLGSFGDNELSPECLDGAQCLLKGDGACIPQNYVSSLEPVSAPALWADARGRVDGSPEHLETGYVVQIHRAFRPAKAPKDCFTFRHPNWSLNSNDRRAELAFKIEADALIHGFAGYFDSELYGGVHISICPGSFSEGMFSWFPIFFPLQVPVFVRKGETLRSHWWRRHDATKVWYEWALSEPYAVPIQNPGGRSWSIGLL